MLLLPESLLARPSEEEANSATPMKCISPIACTQHAQPSPATNGIIFTKEKSNADTLEPVPYLPRSWKRQIKPIVAVCHGLYYLLQEQ
eukprot:1025253-Pelagomonas_calceolata.AAC.1